MKHKQSEKHNHNGDYGCSHSGGLLLHIQLTGEELLQLDMTPKLLSQSRDMKFRAKQHEGADDMEASLRTDNVKRRSRRALAIVESSDDLTDVIRCYFSELIIGLADFLLTTITSRKPETTDTVCPTINGILSTY